jgi:hypothetical protein
MGHEHDGIDISRRQYGRAIRGEMGHGSVSKEGYAPRDDPYGETLEETLAKAREAESRRAEWGKRPVVCLVPRDDPEKPRPAPRKYRYGPPPEV